jgi:predicted dehydrogenase
VLDRLRLGLIGAGGVTVQHLPVLERLGRTELVGVASRRLGPVQRLGVPAYTDARRMLDEQQPDVVFVCVPPDAAPAACELVIERRIPFLVEKPLAANADAPIRLERAIADAGLIVAVGYQWRGLDFLPDLRARLDSRPPRLVVGRWVGDTPPPGWWRKVEQGGGQVVEQATHLFDLARFLVGEASVVAAASERWDRAAYPDADVACVSGALLRFEGGAIGSFSNTCVSPEGLVDLELASDGLHATIRLGGHWPATRWTLTLTDDAGTRVVENRRNPYEVQAEAFLDAVQTGDPTRVLSSYADALKTDRLTRAVVAATGQSG